MRKVWTFFYGSFMNPEVLAKPTSGQRNLKMARLYTADWFGFGTYLPEAVVVADPAGRPVPALSYIAWEMESGAPSAEYMQKVLAVAQQFKFPDWYINRLRSFVSGS